jgi:hypothetical protein
MDRVRISDFYEDDRWGTMVVFTDLTGEQPMEAIHTMPRTTFIKTYRKVYGG